MHRGRGLVGPVNPDHCHSGRDPFHPPCVIWEFIDEAWECPLDNAFRQPHCLRSDSRFPTRYQDARDACSVATQPCRSTTRIFFGGCALGKTLAEKGNNWWRFGLSGAANVPGAQPLQTHEAPQNMSWKGISLETSLSQISGRLRVKGPTTGRPTARRELRARHGRRGRRHRRSRHHPAHHPTPCRPSR